MGEDAMRGWDVAPALKEFVKHDTGKPRTDLLPPRALLGVSRVLALGAAKYGADNWSKCQEPARYLGAALRHVFAHMAGEAKDAESGESHLAHAACCLLFLLELGEKEPPAR
jgi:hypothetical protein